MARRRALGVSRLRRRQAAPGSRRARHLVLVVALAVQHAGLAQGHAGDALLLPDQLAHHRSRHHLLLGGAHDHGRARVHREDAVHRGLPARHRARRQGPEDVQEPGQQPGPDGHHRGVRRRRAALHHDRAHPGRAGRAVQRDQGRAGAQLRQQDLERVAVPVHEPGGLDAGGRMRRRVRPARVVRTPRAARQATPSISPIAGSSRGSTASPPT